MQMRRREVRKEDRWRWKIGKRQTHMYRGDTELVEQKRHVEKSEYLRVNILYIYVYICMYMCAWSPEFSPISVELHSIWELLKSPDGYILSQGREIFFSSFCVLFYFSFLYLFTSFFFFFLFSFYPLSGFSTFQLNFHTIATRCTSFIYFSFFNEMMLL